MARYLKKKSPSQVTLQIAINCEDISTESVATWVQVAKEGHFKGYAGGTQSFTFDMITFDRIIKNFRNHLSYSADSSGVGNSDVIAWDFHHASEMNPTEGTIPTSGAPAQGWTRELEIRTDPQTNRCELWALTRWLEPAKTYIKEKRYKWASVSVIFDAIDQISGLNIGPVLTSIALTNTPFIEGMQQLAASKIGVNLSYYYAADDTEEAFQKVRESLGFPETADANLVFSELERLKVALDSGTDLLGVDLEKITDKLKRILNLPLMTDIETVINEAMKLKSAVGMITSDSVIEPTIEPVSEIVIAEKQKMEILKVLAGKLGVITSESAITDAVDSLIGLKDSIAQQFELSNTSSPRVLLKAVADDSAVRAKYVPLLAALGVEDPDEALNKIANMMAESAKLAEIIPEFTALKQKALEIEEEEIEEEVEEAIMSIGIAATSKQHAGLKVALTALRKNDKAKFYEQYPKHTLAKKHTPRVESSRLTHMLTNEKSLAPAPLNDGTIDVSSFTGPNKVAKTCEYVRASIAGADKWSWEKVHEHACNLVRSNKVSM